MGQPAVLYYRDKDNGKQTRLAIHAINNIVLVDVTTNFALEYLLTHSMVQSPS